MTTDEFINLINERLKFAKSLPPCEMTFAVIGELNHIKSVLLEK